MESKTRFGDLVRNSGRPEMVTMWTKPHQNSSFMKAVKNNRVLTVVQGKGQKRDFGLIGFHEEHDALYLVFPRPLSGKPGGRVVGINYQLIEQPPDSIAASPKRPKPKGK